MMRRTNRSAIHHRSAAHNRIMSGVHSTNPSLACFAVTATMSQSAQKILNYKLTVLQSMQSDAAEIQTIATTNRSQKRI